MDALSGYEQIQQCGLYRPHGSASAGQLVYMIADALLLAQRQGASKAVVNITAMTGFESPGPAFRQWAVSHWARTIGRGVRVAMVARREHICPNKTGLIAAAQEGLDADVFEDEVAALAWLDGSSSNMEMDSRERGSACG
jgi:hypothetical protein